jgi:hypothetical protein
LRKILGPVRSTLPKKSSRSTLVCVGLTVVGLCACAQPAPRGGSLPELRYDDLSCEQLSKEAKRRLREANRNEYLIERNARQRNSKAELSAIKRAILNRGC